MTDSGDGATGGAGRSNATAEAKSGAEPGRLLYPEYGLFESLIGYALFYVVLERVTPTVVDAVGAQAPDLVPEPLTVGLAATLWIVLALTLLGVVTTQARANPRTFADRSERRRFLDEGRPTVSQYRLYALATVGGAAVVVLAWDRYIAVVAALIRLVVSLGAEVPPALSVPNVVVFLVFLFGFAALSRGVDRLAVGGLREILYQVETGDWE